jgi:hypothetical protein
MIDSASAIVGIAAAADGRFDARIGESVGIAHREILRATVAVMHEVVERHTTPEQAASVFTWNSCLRIVLAYVSIVMLLGSARRALVSSVPIATI